MNRIVKGLTAIMMLGMAITATPASASEGVEVNHLSVNNTLVRITGGGRYLLLPVQESIDDAKMNVLVDGKLDKSINVKLAKSKVDYFVPFDLSPYKGHEVVMNVNDPRAIHCA